LSVSNIAVPSKKDNKNIRLLILLSILSLIFTFGYKYVLIVGDSMNPTNKNLQLVVVDKLSYDFEPPKRGDVIVFYDYLCDDFLIKRVIGVPGDTIQIVEGKIYRNQKLHVDQFSHIDVDYHLTLPPETLQEKEYWVIGDNRDDTWFGIIHEGEILGQHKE
jgi:signal peptidase I